MQVYNTVQEMRVDSIDPLLSEYMYAIMTYFPGQELEEFDAALGGQVHIVETNEDLRQIALPQESTLPLENRPSHGWSTPLESATGTDQAAYLYGSQWMIIWTAWNDSGGPTFFIPKAVFDTVPNLDAIVKLSSSSNNDTFSRFPGDENVSEA
jgi:hypothetical protein